MVPAGGALRTKVFTATWPSFATAGTNAYDGTHAGRRGAGNQHSGPHCQVEIRKVSTASTGDALIPGGDSSGWMDRGNIMEGDDVDDYGDADSVVFLNPLLLLRRYNSVSLAGDGKYRLTLSDCHGFVAASPTAAPGFGGEHLGGNEEYGVETARFLFLSLPIALEFEIGGQVSNGGLEIGTFQLVPVAYIPPPPPPPPLQILMPPSPGLEIDDAIGDAESIPAPQPAPLQSPPSIFSTGTVQLSAGGDRGRRGFSGCFLSGAIVGVVAIVSMAWLMLARGWGRSKWERLMKGTGRRDCGGRKGVGAWVTDGGGGGAGSDDGSSDSDALLRGNIPEPVGLPRSDEDWRALFDTLYEDEKD